MSLGGREEPTMQVVVYGPDGRAYGTPAAARAAGVTNYTMSPPAGFPISYPGRQPYTPAPMPSIPTQSYGGRNRYAEIMSQFGQSQPFSFFGMPSGGFNPYAPNYTGGFTPYQRPIPAPALPVEGTTSATAGGGGGGGGGRGLQEGPSAWSQMTPAERAAYYAANPTEGSIALGVQDLLGNATLMGQIGKYFGADNWYDSRLEKLGLDPESFAYGPPDPNFSSQGAAAARQEAQIAAVNAANLAGAGLVANPMGTDPAQAQAAADAAETKSLLNRYPALVAPSAPVVTAPPVEAPAITEGLLSTPPVVSVNEAVAQAAADAAETQSLLSRYPALVEAPVPVVTAPPVEALPPGVMLPNLPAETQSLLSRYPAPVMMEAPAPVVAPAPVITAPAAPSPAPVPMVNVTETYQGDDPNPPGDWTRTRIGRDDYRLTRTVSVPAEIRVNQEDGRTYTVPVGYTGSGGGYYGDATPGGSFGFVQAPGEAGRGGGGYGGGGDGAAGRGEPGGDRGGWGRGGGYAKGGYVSMQHLGGPNPEGPDDGYAALKDGEYVINNKAVKKYGIELMNAINSGKISKGKLRGLLEM